MEIFKNDLGKEFDDQHGGSLKACSSARKIYPCEARALARERQGRPPGGNRKGNGPKGLKPRGYASSSGARNKKALSLL
jgi:hypothetical protein